MPSKGKGKGKGKKKQTHQKKTKPPKPFSTCIFPEQIITNILSRLPVKSLARFKCVSKAWRSFISNPKFIVSHVCRSPSTLIIQSVKSDGSGKLVSFLNHPNGPILAPVEGPISTVGRDCFSVAGMDVVGSSCGIVCLSNVPPKQDDNVFIWNPATRQAKAISLSDTSIFKREVDTQFSMGFGYDLMANDYKIVILFHRPELKFTVEVEVYSVNFGSWRKSIFPQKLLDFRTKCDAVIGGVPCWLASVQHGKRVSEVLLYYDIITSFFMEYSLPVSEKGSCKRIVNLKVASGIAMLVWDEMEKHFFDLWVMDDNAWSKKFYAGPIFGVERVVGCSFTGEIVVENDKGCVSFYDIRSRKTTNMDVDGSKVGTLEVFNYMESLVSFPGEMKTIKFKQKCERTEAKESCSTVLKSIWYPHWYYHKSDFRSQWREAWRKARFDQQNSEPDETSPP